MRMLLLGSRNDVEGSASASSNATRSDSWSSLRGRDSGNTPSDTTDAALPYAHPVTGADSTLAANMARVAPPAPPAAAPVPPATPAAAAWRSSMASVLDDSPGPPAGCEPDAIKLFVGNIPKSCSELHLLPLFESVGHVVELAIMRDRDVQGSKGSAFLWYSTRAAAEMAIQKFHLRYILHDPVGENNRRLVLRRAWAKGDANYTNTGPPSGGGAGVVAQMLYLSLGPNNTNGGMPPNSPGSQQQQQQQAAANGGQSAAQGKPSFVALSYQSQAPLATQSSWTRQPAPAPARQGLDPGPGLAATGRPYPASSPLPLSPNLTMTGQLSSTYSNPLSQLPSATTSARSSSRPSSSTYPASLTSTGLSQGGLVTAGPRPGSGPGYAEQPAYRGVPPGQLAQQLDLLSVVQRGAGGNRPYSMDAVAGLHTVQETGAQMGAHGLGSGLAAATPAASSAASGTTTHLLDAQQLHVLVDYLHSLQAMCGAEIAVTMPPLPGCFQLRLSGSQAHVQAGKVLIDSLLGITYPPIQ